MKLGMSRVIAAFGLAMLMLSPQANAATAPQETHTATSVSISEFPIEVSDPEYPSELEIRTEIERFKVLSPSGEVVFDEIKAIDAEVDPRIIEIGILYNELKNTSELGTPEYGTRDLNPTNYGNWCGKYNSGPGAPINSLDQACKNHDICLQQSTPTCDCDYRFVQSLRTIRYQYSGWDRTYLEAAILAVPAWHGCRV